MHVNLLRKSEIRYQGIVTKKFSIFVPILTIVLGALIFTPIHIMKTTMNRSKIRSMTEQLEQLETVVQRANELEKICNHNQSILDELKNREKHTLSVSDLLNAIQTIVPTTIQLTALTYNATPQTKEGKVGANWTISIGIDGEAIAAAPEAVVIPFGNTIANLPFMRYSFDTVNLINFNRVSSGDTLETAVFHISGSGNLKDRSKKENSTQRG